MKGKIILMPVHFKIDEIRLINAEYSYRKIDEGIDTAENESISRPVKLDIGCTTHFTKKDRNLKVTLSVSCAEPYLPYSFKATVGGSFILDSVPKKTEIDRISNINCAAIIYPFLREFISDLIKRGGDKPLYLPVFNFVDLYENSKKKKKKKVSGKAKASKSLPS